MAQDIWLEIVLPRLLVPPLVQWASPLAADSSLMEGRGTTILIRDPTRDGRQQGRRLPPHQGMAALTLVASLLRQKDEES